MKHALSATLSTALALPLFTACTATDASDAAEEHETVVAAEDLPETIAAAARAAVPGLRIEEAELEGDGVYCVHGWVNDDFYEVEIDAAGNVLEIEQGVEDEGEDDADEDHHRDASGR